MRALFRETGSQRLTAEFAGRPRIFRGRPTSVRNPDLRPPMCAASSVLQFLDSHDLTVAGDQLAKPTLIVVRKVSKGRNSGTALRAQGAAQGPISVCNLLELGAAIRQLLVHLCNLTYKISRRPLGRSGACRRHARTSSPC